MSDAGKIEQMARQLCRASVPFKYYGATGKRRGMGIRRSEGHLSP
jgi:hypothetical protein